MGPFIYTSNSVSLISIGGITSLNTHSGSAKLIVTFLKDYIGLFSKYFMISMPTAPTTIAVVVASAGIILPAINLTLKLSTYLI